MSQQGLKVSRRVISYKGSLFTSPAREPVLSTQKARSGNERLSPAGFTEMQKLGHSLRFPAVCGASLGGGIEFPFPHITYYAGGRENALFMQRRRGESPHCR